MTNVLDFTQQSLFQQVTVLRKQSRSSEALGLLRDALRRGRLDAEGVDKAGRRILKELAAWEPGRLDARVLVLGQCTTSWLMTALCAVAWGRGSAVLVGEGEYDNVVQELLASAEEKTHPDVVVLVPWNRRLLSGGERPPEARIDEELAFWQQAWAVVRDRLGSRILQIGYDWMTPGAFGHFLGGNPDGAVALVREVNRAIRRELPAGSYFVDLEQVSGAMGRRLFYDPRRYFWTKQPFSEAGTVRLAEHVWAGVRAMTTGPKKVLVVDLDNTLWGGVVGETGPLGVALGESPDGEAFRAFQEHLRGLARRGVVLTVCSKNNADDAREPFLKNPDMVLSLDDFADFQASWDPKAVAIRRTAETLRLGLDSFVFFDDNPAEREHVRQALPEVEVVDVPDDPAEYVRALEAGLWFESVALTADDQQRARQYQEERRRRELQSTAGSLEDYLRSLGMRGDVRPIDEPDMQRVVQLIGKTNQFNLTTRRHSREDVLRMLAEPGAIGLTLRLADRFGDHGLVGVILAVPATDAAQTTLRIDTLLMSCRVIGRTAEQFFFNALVDRAREERCRELTGEYLPTKKNGLVADLYDRLGLERIEESADGAVRYRLDLSGVEPAVTYVEHA